MGTRSEDGIEVKVIERRQKYFILRVIVHPHEHKMHTRRGGKYSVEATFKGALPDDVVIFKEKIQFPGKDMKTKRYPDYLTRSFRQGNCNIFVSLRKEFYWFKNPNAEPRVTKKENADLRRKAKREERRFWEKFTEVSEDTHRHNYSPSSESCATIYTHNNCRKPWRG